MELVSKVTIPKSEISKAIQNQIKKLEIKNKYFETRHKNMIEKVRELKNEIKELKKNSDKDKISDALGNLIKIMFKEGVLDSYKIHLDTEDIVSEHYDKEY